MRHYAVRCIALRCVFDVISSSKRNCDVASVCVSPLYQCVCVCVDDSVCRLQLFVVYVAFCSLATSRRNDVECPIDVALCLLPALFGYRHHRRLRVRISPLAFAICLRQNSRKSQQKKTTEPATHTGKCQNAEMPQRVRQRERIATAAAAAAERSQRSRNCRVPLADWQIPNEAKNVHTCSMQTDRRQWARGWRGRGGGRQANFFGVNAFCTKTWFFGCQRCSWRRCRHREQRCFRSVSVAARFFFCFFLCFHDCCNFLCARNCYPV